MKSSSRQRKGLRSRPVAILELVSGIALVVLSSIAAGHGMRVSQACLSPQGGVAQQASSSAQWTCATSYVLFIGGLVVGLLGCFLAADGFVALKEIRAAHPEVTPVSDMGPIAFAGAPAAAPGPGYVGSTMPSDGVAPVTSTAPTPAPAPAPAPALRTTVTSHARRPDSTVPPLPIPEPPSSPVLPTPPAPPKLKGSIRSPWAPSTPPTETEPDRTGGSPSTPEAPASEVKKPKLKGSLKRNGAEESEGPS